SQRAFECANVADWLWRRWRLAIRRLGAARRESRRLNGLLGRDRSNFPNIGENGCTLDGRLVARSSGRIGSRDADPVASRGVIAKFTDVIGSSVRHMNKPVARLGMHCRFVDDGPP